ncbi:hypothetical protein QOZ80_2BG0180660 [Eleusine coracana subsp. coracana]|nr:hypothetical protein QOZ80_2BG0180660 [Eleusine coracana subsp. coracana]
MDTPAKIEGNHRWDPYFKDCIGAIDGTHVRASVTKAMEPAFREGFGEQAQGPGQASWTSTQSSFMLSYLSNVVASGTRTSSGFKKVHLNACARAVNEKFNTSRTGDQIKNHLKTWQRKFSKLQKLRKVSGSGWDQENYIITLGEEHYNDYVQNPKSNKSDAEYFNKPLENYAEMATIFENNMATGNYAKDSSSALGTEDAAHEDEAAATAVPNIPDETGASSSATRPNKRARIAENDETEGLIGAFKSGSERIANAIEKLAGELPSDLLEKAEELPGFDTTHKSYYYSHLAGWKIFLQYTI